MTNFAFKARLMLKQGQSPEAVLETITQEADKQLTSMDRLLAQFVEEATPEQLARLMPPESLGEVD